MDQTATSIWLTVAVPIGASVLGGILATFASYYATKQAHRNQLTLEAERERKGSALSAYRAFSKLRHAYETAANLQNYIDECFAKADREGKTELEPWAKVMTLAGSDYEEEPIDPAELRFLFDRKQAELMGEVLLVQRRIWNISASVRVYDKYRAELMAFLEEHASSPSLEDGTLSVAEFEGKLAAIIAMKESRLNSLVGQVMELLDEDVPRSWKALLKFKQAAEEHFDGDFPVFKLEQAK